VYYGNWKCPYCAQFSTGEAQGVSLGDIVTDYVSSGDVHLTYRALSYTSNGPFLGSDAPRAARAGLAVWNVDPDSYWAFHEEIMANQPPEKKSWATVEKLTAFAEDAGVDDVDTVREQIRNGEYESAVRDTTDASNAAGVSGTPTLVADGRTASPFKESQARSLLDSL
jgi:protein-disulfide isomerase